MTAMAYLSMERFHPVAFHSKSLKCNSVRTVHACLHLLGHVAFCMYVTLLHARLHNHCLPAWLHSIYCVTMPPLDMQTPWLLQSLDWWLDLCNVCRGVPFLSPVLNMTLVTDVYQGLGTHLSQLQAQGLWSPQEFSPHKFLECRAICWACKMFMSAIKNHVI